MSTYPMVDPTSQHQIDEQHLRYLVIANYIYAALHLVTLLAIIGIVLFASGAIALGSPQIDPQELPIIGLVGGLVGFIVVLIPLGSTLLQFVLARFLEQRRSHTYCFAVSILNCLSMPFGTILGVLTLIVLMRPSVQSVFAEEKSRRDAAEIATARGVPAHGPQ